METVDPAVTIERIRKALERIFPGAQIELEYESSTDKIGGSVLWDGFYRKSFLTRQKAIYRAIRRELGSKANVVSLILTNTPNEYAQMMAVDMAAD